MTVNAWLLDNIGMEFTQVTVLLGLLASIAVNVLLALDRRAAKTNILNNATIKNLEVSLAAERLSLAKAISDAESAKTSSENNQKKLEARENDIAILHSKISDLKKLMAERPSLIMQGHYYCEAFPDNPNSPKLFCADCWENTRILSPIHRVGGAYSVCGINRRHGR